MKINLNLAVAPSFRERFALAWSVPTALVAFAVMIALVYSTVSAFRTYRKSQAELEGPASQESALAAREAALRQALDRPDLRDTLRQAQFINSLIERKQLSLAELAVKVSGLLPPEARLNALALTRSDRDAVARFEVIGRSPQALESFLSNLSSSPEFEDTAISSEGFVEKDAGTGEVTVACTARYVGGRRPDDHLPAGQKAPAQAGSARSQAGS